MKTGIELINEERQEQIHKHGFSLELDKEHYQNKELFQAAMYCLMLAEYRFYKGKNVFWPDGWERSSEQRIINKSTVGKLIVAGALLLAENERRKDNLHQSLITEIAEEIDRINDFYERALWYNPKTGQTAKSLPEITGLNDNHGCYLISTANLHPAYTSNEFFTKEEQNRCEYELCYERYFGRKLTKEIDVFSTNDNTLVDFACSVHQYFGNSERINNKLLEALKDMVGQFSGNINSIGDNRAMNNAREAIKLTEQNSSTPIKTGNIIEKTKTLPSYCQSKKDGVCNLPINSCIMCKDEK